MRPFLLPLPSRPGREGSGQGGRCSFLPDRTAKLFDNNGKTQDNGWFRSEGFPSGQRGQTVNLLAQPSKVRILPPPPVIADVGEALGFSMEAGLDEAGVAQW